ncbi:hypothetical protein BVH03_13800 [Pseudomonas sp. PA15(2017)]|uniref:DUF1460 domain-containing protein n=1 Tax=Pseudomonas sp. PA15(2017) TaxID=1932111 RepID=UPI000961E619|nr:DUF1460 domain-containing protein [Pseudomonas sp. PA15(2017)]OLU27301.1 hypothetical protein BVH03_13800 [Pseudomonas sp. PA15(2017)]
MRRTFFSALASALLAGSGFSSGAVARTAFDAQPGIQRPANMSLDPYTSQKVAGILEQRPGFDHLSIGQVIERISGWFLGTPYQAGMLHGAENTPERLVIDFRGLDCFTYLDYVEALRVSASPAQFMQSVIQTRYVDGDVSFPKRKHFFSDWAYGETHNLADDITAHISPDALSVEKHLNEKANGESYLPGLPVVKRTIPYIPSELIDATVVSRLQTGDLIGIYTRLPGLDVTHTGFFIMTDEGPVLRHASSSKANEQVVDSPFLDYVANVPGIVIFRIKAS